MIIPIHGMLKGPVTLIQQFMMKFYRREKPKVECLNIAGPRLAGLENKISCYSQLLWQLLLLLFFFYYYYFKIKNSEKELDPSNTFKKI